MAKTGAEIAKFLRVGGGVWSDTELEAMARGMAGEAYCYTFRTAEVPKVVQEAAKARLKKRWKLEGKTDAEINERLRKAHVSPVSRGKRKGLKTRKEEATYPFRQDTKTKKLVRAPRYVPPFTRLFDGMKYQNVDLCGTPQTDYYRKIWQKKGYSVRTVERHGTTYIYARKK